MKKIISTALAVLMISTLICAGVSALLRGDANGDGELDNKDVVLIFRYLSSPDRLEDETVYDYNEDGSVDNKDVVSLFRYISQI